MGNVLRRSGSQRAHGCRSDGEARLPCCMAAGCSPEGTMQIKSSKSDDQSLGYIDSKTGRSLDWN